MIAAVVLAVSASTTTSCTVGKPIVSAFTSIPILLPEMVSNVDSIGRHDCSDPHAVVLFPALMVAPAILTCALASAVGASSGLVTGFVSDLHWVAGNVRDPFKNLQNPFATSAVRGSRLWRPRVLR